MAAVSEFRRLREDLVVVQQETPEGVLFVVKDPDSRRYFKFEANDFAIIECFRGATSLEEVIRRYGEANPGRALDPESAGEFEAALADMGLLERTLVEKNLMVMEKIRDGRHKKAGAEQGGNIFFITFPAVNPDRFLARVHPYIRFFWQPWFVVLCLGGMVVMAGIFATHWEQITRSTLDFYNFREKSASDIFEFLALMFVIVTIHEFGHAFTCKNFGGEVKEIGFVLFYFTPAFYCDVNDAYLFEKKWPKLWVTFAGAYIELLICVVATFVWLGTRPDSGLNDISYKVILFTGLSSIAFNINPLVKLDGYYVLMDYLEIPNLRERAFEYVGYQFQRRILRMKVARPVTTRRQRRIFVIYGILSAVYTAVILVLVFSIARNWMNALFPGWGLVLALILVALMMRKRVRPLAAALERIGKEKKEDWMTRRAAMMISGGTVAALALLILPQFPTTIGSAVTLEPERVIRLAGRADGFVERVEGGEGDRIRKGETVAVLHNDELEVRLKSAESRRDLAESRARSDLAAGRTAQALENRRRAEELATRAGELRRQLGSLELRAPEEGIVLTPRLEDRVGTFFRAGAPVLEIGAATRMRAMVRVSEWDVRWVSVGQKVRIRLDAFPRRVFRGRVDALAPATTKASGNHPDRTFEVRVLLENPEALLRPGMAGRAKISARSRSILERIAQFSRDSLRSLFW